MLWFAHRVYACPRLRGQVGGALKKPSHNRVDLERWCGSTVEGWQPSVLRMDGAARLRAPVAQVVLEGGKVAQVAHQLVLVSGHRWH